MARRWLLSLALVLGLALALAPAAGAELGVTGFQNFRDYLPTPNPGSINTGRDIAVNGAGSGGASAGDYYVIDNNRVQQFSSAGEFKRAFGPNVVSSGPGNADETQAIQIFATGGTFTLSFGGEVTPPLPFNASAAAVESALNALASIGGVGASVTVTGGPGDETGSSPYLVTFGGVQADAAQPLITVDHSGLTGPGATSFVASTNRGGTGFEICEPTNGDTCASGGGLSYRGVAVNESTGDVYVMAGNRVEQYSATGQFTHAFGYDVVVTGPHDSDTDEEQSVKVEATGGSFELQIFVTGFGQQTTAPIPYNASPEEVEAALNALPGIGTSAGGSFSVTGGPGDATGSSPYIITWGGVNAGDNKSQFTGVATNLTGTPKSVTVTTIKQGGEAEVCHPNDVCGSGSNEPAPGGFAAFNSSIAVAPPGAPNEGRVFLAESRARVQEFDSEGQFIRMFGWDVNATNPSTEFEVCTKASGDTCQAGVQGLGLGQLSSRLGGAAVNSDGVLYVADSRRGSGGGGVVGYRVKTFTFSGEEITPALFGKSEVQRVTVKATAGTFRLGIVDPEGVKGRGSIGNDGITNVTVDQGTFKVGQPIEIGSTPPGTRITEVTPTTINVDHRIGSLCGNPEFCTFSAPEIKYTSDLPANATAAEVEAALNALGPISELGGSVTVSGGPGDATGSSPYVITFDGGVMARTDQPQIVTAQGTPPLSGGSGEGADTAVSEVVTEGGPNGRTTGATSGLSGDDKETPLDVAIGPNDEVFVVKNYRSGWGTCENGLLAAREARVLEFDSEGNRVDSSKPCAYLESFTTGERSNPQLSVNSSTGVPYLFTNEESWFNPPLPCCQGGPRTYLLGDVGSRPALDLDPPSNISPTGATVSGTINPNGPGAVEAPHPANTEYRLEYKRTTETEWEVYAPDVSVGSGTSSVPFSVGISGLTPKAEYEAKVVVTKPFGFEPVSDITTFTTLAAPPRINAVSADHISANSADLHAVINPLGTATSYHFEYGKTPAYGQSTPETPIGDSLSPVAVTEHLEGLDPELYHFRVVATNELGSTVSTDQTFNFYPETCPNATVRQQTGSGNLPDCRAYELVSPGNAGSATLLPGGPNTGYSRPSRLAFYAGLGSIPGPWNPPNSLADMYVATRGATGWTTSYVGIPGEEAGATTGPPNGEGHPIGGVGGQTVRGEVMANLTMDKFIGWSSGHQGFTCCGLAGSLAPYVFDAQGNGLGRWPTNASGVVGGLEDIACWTNKPLPPCGPPGGFNGDVRPSGDFSHYFFSSMNVAFTPDGQTSGIGSVYDNDIESGTVMLTSRQPNGEPIEREPAVTTDDYMALPHAAVDGSNILMAASGSGICGKFTCQPPPFPCGANDAGFDNSLSLVDCPALPPSHLYMRVDNAVTYDVSQGHLVDYQGATDDASKVFFTSGEQITADDHDTSVDLFMWSEETDEITRVSAGPGTIGDTDACNSAWATKCGVEVATPQEFVFALFGQLQNSVIDNDGGVYFYSPEQFVGSNGIPGRRNLYVSRDGEIDYVATLDSDKPATRIQVSKNGSFAAFITASRLTPYDNEGVEQMYRYEAASGELICVSCLPTGDPPTSDVEGSQNGLYISEDGRTFFTTSDPLVPQDTNGLRDVYEYVSGRPQLISTGIGNRDVSGLGVTTGLVGVSADGVDVFFSTLETLVPEDRNGGFLKFYDARVNGGFPSGTAAAPCAAADECHGSGTPPMAVPTLGSTANLGAAGNVRDKAKTKARKKKRRKRRSRHRRRARKKGKRHGAKQRVHHRRVG